MQMRILKYFTLLLFLVTASCTDLGEFREEGYKVPCKVIVEINACGIKDIGRNLPWLNAIIVTSMNDQSTVYVGRFWCKNYNGQDYIVTDMPKYAVGQMYHTFNCSGESVTVSDDSFYPSLTDRDIVWISYCPQPGVDQ